MGLDVPKLRTIIYIYIYIKLSKIKMTLRYIDLNPSMKMKIPKILCSKSFRPKSIGKYKNFHQSLQ